MSARRLRCLVVAATALVVATAIVAATAKGNGPIVATTTLFIAFVAIDGGVVTATTLVLPVVASTSGEDGSVVTAAAHFDSNFGDYGWGRGRYIVNDAVR